MAGVIETPSACGCSPPNIQVCRRTGLSAGAEGCSWGCCGAHSGQGPRPLVSARGSEGLFPCLACSLASPWSWPCICLPPGWVRFGEHEQPRLC